MTLQVKSPKRWLSKYIEFVGLIGLLYTKLVSLDLQQKKVKFSVELSTRNQLNVSPQIFACQLTNQIVFVRKQVLLFDHFEQMQTFHPYLSLWLFISYVCFTKVTLLIPKILFQNTTKNLCFYRKIRTQEQQRWLDMLSGLRRLSMK